MNKFFFLFIIVIIALGACDEENDLNAFSIGDEFIRSETTVAIVDTYKVRMSTLMVDSIPTSKTGILMAGQYIDSYFGQINANAYMQFSLPTSYTPEEDDKVDSLVLRLKYINQTYGDTLKKQTFEVYRLEEEMELNDDGRLYNTSSFKHSENPIGSYTFIPRPGRDRYLEIRLPDELAQEFFDKKFTEDENDNDLQDLPSFLKYFNGLVLKNATNGGAILSFGAVDSTVSLVLHTSRVELEKKVIKYKFNLNTGGIYFNEIENDHSNTSLNVLQAGGDNISSTQTDNKSYMQGGVGIFTRLEFPSLPSLLNTDKDFVLVKAELLLKPVRGSYDDVPLTPEIVFYNSDKKNRIVSELQDDDNRTLPATLVIDEVYKEETYYQYDLTNFITSELLDAHFDVEHGILVGLTSSKMGASLDRVVFDSSRNSTFRPVLKIYYIFYN